MPSDYIAINRVNWYSGDNDFFPINFTYSRYKICMIENYSITDFKFGSLKNTGDPGKKKRKMGVYKFD
jgi:hypothetical protein